MWKGRGMKQRTRKHPRGMTLIVALGILAVVTAATLVSLRIVSQETDLQGRERRTREAFFAAEAGLAEGREVLTALVGTGTPFLPPSPCPSSGCVFQKLGDAYSPGSGFWGVVNEPNFPGNGMGWFQVIPSTHYSLAAGTGKAVDPNVTTPSWELRDSAGKAFLSFPEQSSVTYRVFAHDDDDEPGVTNRLADINGAVWLVSVGEVQAKDGTVLARSVVRVLVTAGSTSQVASGYTGQAGGGDSKGAGGSLDKNPPVLTQSSTF